MDARRIPSTPSMTIYLTEKYRKDENKVRELINADPPTMYVNAVAPVINPTRAYQLGNGARNIIPMITDSIIGRTGTWVFFNNFINSI